MDGTPITDPAQKMVSILGVAIITSKLIMKLLKLENQIMQVKVKHTLCFMSFIALYVPTKVCSNEEMLHIRLSSTLNQGTHSNALIVFGDIITNTCFERAS